MIRPPSKPPGFIRPCLPALANKPPPGLDWLHEIKFNGHRVIARKDGERVRLWARTRSDYSDAFMRIRESVAALPVDSAVLDGEAVVLRPDQTSDFEALRSPNGQAAAVLVAYDLMEVDGHDVRPESLEERRTRLAKLLSRKNNPIGDGIQLSEAITGDGDAIFRHACYMGLEGIVSKRIGSRYVSGRTRVWLKTKNPGFRIGVDASQARTAAVAPGFLANIRGEQSGTSD
jgi:bifunctional non-homologous end joining protein LigD